MNKKIKVISLILAASMMLSVAGCKLNPGKPDDTKETTTKATTEQTEDTKKPLETIETSESSESSEAANSGKYPEKGCAINFPKEDRYLYKMNLTLDDKKNTVGGHVDVTFFNNSDEAWDKLCLRDYPSLFKNPKDAGYDAGVETHGAISDINNIVDGRSGASINMERDKDVSVVWFPLATKLAPGEKMTLSYDFTATIPTAADRFGVYDGVFNVTNFYPILAVYTKDGWSHERFYGPGECFYSEIADFDVKLTVPSDMVILSTGLENGETQNGDSKTVSIYAECVRDFVFCGSKEFKLVEGDYKNTHIRVAYTEEDNADFYKEMADISLKASVDSLEALGSAFGEYPYKDLEVIYAPIAAGGMEYPNLVIIDKIQPFSDLPDQDNSMMIQQMADSVISHEIGHQWFMGIVGSNSGTQPWLDESLASFTEYVYEKKVYGDKSWGVVIDDGSFTFDDTTDNKEEDKREIPINQGFYDYKNEWTYISAVYYRGKSFYQRLYDILGEEEIYGILREYVQRFAFKNADQMDLFNILYEYVGTDNEEVNKLIYKNFNDDVQPDKANVAKIEDKAA